MEKSEVANVLTHGVGVAASVAAAAVLIISASLGGDPWEIVGVSVFSATLILLYSASTMYHAATVERSKARLKVLDHCAIYLLIAGTYTPFVIGALRGAWGWTLFGIIWGLACVGIVLKLRYTGRFNLLSTLCYIGMGWLVVIGAVPLVRAVTPAALAWLVAGGVLYTAGTPFFQTQRVRHSHAIWHGFVLAGSACHTIAVALQI